ncbi:hypothetical protein J6590_013898 [Homalodisca vitripennis]|nr:hypothetical protein J6590_013898 [Homalodisca vitripennis]
MINCGSDLSPGRAHAQLSAQLKLLTVPSMWTDIYGQRLEREIRVEINFVRMSNQGAFFTAAAPCHSPKPLPIYVSTADRIVRLRQDIQTSSGFGRINKQADGNNTNCMPEERKLVVAPARRCGAVVRTKRDLSS